MQTRNVENLLHAHLAPLADEIEQMLDTLQHELEGRDLTTLDSSEVDAIVEGYVPSQRLSPAFENFGLGVLKKVAKAAAKVAGGFVLGKFIAAVKKLAPILLRRVVSVAINKLPAQYQPLARKVAEKLGVAKETEEEDEGETALEAT
jgi:hypothetical protein